MLRNETKSLQVIDKDEQQKLLEDDNSESSESEETALSRKAEHATSNFDTMIHLLKANVGTGILAMPDAFRNSGWLVGVVGTIIIGFVCTHCMHMLVECSHELCRRTRKPSLDFAQVVECAFETGPRAVQKFSKIARKLVGVFLCVTQLGFCCVYFVFVAANLHDFVKHYYREMSLHWYLVILLFPMILLNFVKNLKYLTPASLLASILTCLGSIVTFFYMFQQLPSTSTVKAFSSWSQLPQYFGIAIYAFEGIGVVLPLENNMKSPKDFGGWTGVLNISMILVTTLYTAVGFFGYLKYGELAVLGSVTLLLPSNELLAQSVRLTMAVAIFFSYSLQFYVPFNIIWPTIKDYFRTEESERLAERVTRILLVFLTFVLAMSIPNLGTVISLVGAFSSSALALIFPPIIEIVTFSPKIGKKHWILWKNVTIALFGVVGFIVGSYVSLIKIW